MQDIKAIAKARRSRLYVEIAKFDAFLETAKELLKIGERVALQDNLGASGPNAGMAEPVR